MADSKDSASPGPEHLGPHAHSVDGLPPAAVGRVPNTMRALVADDDPTTKAIVTRALERCGLVVTSPDNGATAWERVTAGRPAGITGARLDDALS